MTGVQTCALPISAVARPLFVNLGKKGKTIGLCGVILLTGALSSLVVTTAGLVWILGYNFYAIMPGRLVQFAIMMPTYCVVTSLLYFSPLTGIVIGTLRPAVMKKKIV